MLKTTSRLFKISSFTIKVSCAFKDSSFLVTRIQVRRSSKWASFWISLRSKKNSINNTNTIIVDSKVPQLKANKWSTNKSRYIKHNRISNATLVPKRINRLIAKNPKYRQRRLAGPQTHPLRTAVANSKLARIITCKISCTHPPRPACLSIRAALVTNILSLHRPTHPSKASKTRKAANNLRPP